MTSNIDMPPWRAFEESIADYYRECGATKVEVDTLLAGNQIDIYIHELTMSGNSLRTIVECKHLAEPVGVKEVNEFAGVFERVKVANLAEKAVLVSASAFSKPARQAAEAAHIALLTKSDIDANLSRVQSLSLVTVASRDVALVLALNGRLLGYKDQPVSSALESELVADPNLTERVKLIAEYIRELERLATDPSGPVVSVDLTGSGSAFANWISNPLYRAALQAGGKYVEAYRKQHGNHGLAALRSFVLDPSDISPQFIKNLETTLRLHLAVGVHAGIIFQNSQVPGEVVADIANMADRLCVDYGRLEPYGGKAPRLLDIMAPNGDPQFKRIRERVAWTADPKNLDTLVKHPSDIDELIKELTAKLERATKE